MADRSPRWGSVGRSASVAIDPAPQMKKPFFSGNKSTLLGVGGQLCLGVTQAIGLKDVTDRLKTTKLFLQEPEGLPAFCEAIIPWLTDRLVGDYSGDRFSSS
ncbi:hypothetical protein [Laspinema olomoucense]|uniref:hypothetical protein n=1 Tax=Laspinema olomoucense TaxID=3231600 RepID=UPI0021BAD572|nr:MULTISPECIES: hypothetical protein [unclassified Laspinema]MCT7973706.1 hypothetical protein [Laspinema sp. D3d]MCT7996595.1 hypothetical protein [Laspinema sp. D3c]